MSTINNGGPAFPHIDMEWVAEEQQWKKPASTGMTLRDYFAAKAMQGMLIGEIAVPESSNEPFDNLASASYMLADAMLKARDA